MQSAAGPSSAQLLLDLAEKLPHVGIDISDIDRDRLQRLSAELVSAVTFPSIEVMLPTLADSIERGIQSANARRATSVILAAMFMKFVGQHLHKRLSTLDQEGSSYSCPSHVPKLDEPIFDYVSAEELKQRSAATASAATTSANDVSHIIQQKFKEAGKIREATSSDRLFGSRSSEPHSGQRWKE